MAIHLPLTGTDLREKLGDTAHLVEILHPDNIKNLPHITLTGVREYVKNNWIEGATSIFVIWNKFATRESPVFVELTKNDPLIQENEILLKILWDFRFGEFCHDEVFISLD